MIDLPAIRERAAAFEAAQKKASKGSWSLGKPTKVAETTYDIEYGDAGDVPASVFISNVKHRSLDCYSVNGMTQLKSDCELAILARNTTLAADVRGLCAEIERLRSENAALIQKSHLDAATINGLRLPVDDWK